MGLHKPSVMACSFVLYLPTERPSPSAGFVIPAAPAAQARSDHRAVSKNTLQVRIFNAFAMQIFPNRMGTPTIKSLKYTVSFPL
jgi:hypothetical protein